MAKQKRDWTKTPAGRVFAQSNGGLTTAYLKRLRERGPRGKIAAELFVAQKASERAKMYRGEYVEVAYDRKSSGIEALCRILAEENCGLQWGWKLDIIPHKPPCVLYINLPDGQVSFHSYKRFVGPDYPNTWDGSSLSRRRILLFCDSVMEWEPYEVPGGEFWQHEIGLAVIYQNREAMEFAGRSQP